MNDSLRLMCILAHPEDESLGAGGILARYSGEGVATSLICATHGERGWTGSISANPGMTAVGLIRETELRRAAQVLGLHQAHMLDFVDGDLDQVDPGVIVPQIAALVRHVRPQVVVTFDPNGSYGHPDHIALCQFTHSALMLAADSCANVDGPPHQVLKLYYLVETREEWETYLSVFGETRMLVDGVERLPIPWEDWAVTTRVDTSMYRDVVWQAVACHRSQIPSDEGFRQTLAKSDLWRTQTLYRAMSMVNSGREREDDLFAGIRLPVREPQPFLLHSPCRPAVQAQP